MEPPIYSWLRQGLQTLLPLTRPKPPTWNDYRLTQWLGVQVSELGSVRLGRRYHYRPATITKADGRERCILAPSAALKAAQRSLVKNYLAQLPIHPAATAFHRHASIVANARKHLDQEIVLTVDLADFFESTSGERTRAFFVKQGWTGEALEALMHTCVYRNGLPQGAPTSPCLSNLVNFELDQVLANLARLSGARYTRYADDLTFSWRTASVPGDFIARATDVFERFGYEVQLRKGWKVQRATEAPRVVGVVLGDDGRLRAPMAVRWEYWKLRWQWWRRRDKSIEARMRGYEGFLKMFD